MHLRLLLLLPFDFRIKLIALITFHFPPLLPEHLIFAIELGGMWRTLRGWLDRHAWLAIGLWLSTVAITSGALLIFDGHLNSVHFISSFFSVDEPTPVDRNAFVDVDGYTCDQWLGYDCNLATTVWGYSVEDADSVAFECQMQCDLYLPAVRLRQGFVCSHLQKRIAFDRKQQQQRASAYEVPSAAESKRTVQAAGCNLSSGWECHNEAISNEQTLNLEKEGNTISERLPDWEDDDNNNNNGGGGGGDNEWDEDDDEPYRDPVGLWKAAECQSFDQRKWVHATGRELVEFLVPDWVGVGVDGVDVNSSSSRRLPREAYRTTRSRYDFNHGHRNLRVVLIDTHGYVDENKDGCSAWYGAAPRPLLFGGGYFIGVLSSRKPHLRILADAPCILMTSSYSVKVRR